MFWVDKAAWIEVALTVTPEQAEAVAERIGLEPREATEIGARQDHPLEVLRPEPCGIRDGAGVEDPRAGLVAGNALHAHGGT